MAAALKWEASTGSIYELQICNGHPVADEAEPMRYALRNRDSIKASCGDEFYIELVKCLSHYFKTHDEPVLLSVDGLDMPAITMAGLTPHSTHIFAVLAQKYDVITLSYYKTTSNNGSNRN